MCLGSNSNSVILIYEVLHSLTPAQLFTHYLFCSPLTCYAPDISVQSQPLGYPPQDASGTVHRLSHLLYEVTQEICTGYFICWITQSSDLHRVGSLCRSQLSHHSLRKITISANVGIYFLFFYLPCFSFISLIVQIKMCYNLIHLFIFLCFNCLSPNDM